MKEVISKELAEADVTSPLSYYLRPGEWLRRKNNTALQGGSGPFVIMTYIKACNDCYRVGAHHCGDPANCGSMEIGE